MNNILFGPPGSGKGTQADKIVNQFNFYKISTGDLLRQEINKKTNLGVKIKSIIDNGSLVSDEIINTLISKILINIEFSNRLVFDVYPRNVEQAKSLNQLMKNNNQVISCVINLKANKDSIVKRILGRQTCTNCGLIFNEYFRPSTEKNHKCGKSYLTKRTDDNEKTAIHRFQTYIDKTLPILEFYKKLNLLHEINGMDEIDQIFKEICVIIRSLEP